VETVLAAQSLAEEAERIARALENRAYVRWLLRHEESGAVAWLRCAEPGTLAWLQAGAADHCRHVAV